jgi:hypothetical protein
MRVWCCNRAATARIALLSLVLTAWTTAAHGQTTAALPERLTDESFWALAGEMSEENGYFQSDNLVGNERPLQQIVPALRRMKRGGAYLGVAPDQNFTYIVALEPRIAFIVDIRRGNFLEHLMYKAIIELSPTRAEFLSRLFSVPQGDAPADATAAQLLAHLPMPEPDTAIFERNVTAITEQLVRVHGFPLSAGDLESIRAIYEQFFLFGPSLTYSSSNGGGRGNMPTYAELQVQTDLDGKEQSYLATEESYRFLRSFQERNLLVPIVGDFAGPKALRAVGRYLAAHGATVTAFYVSNVEQYLFRNAVADAFYENVATLPLDTASVFLRSASGRNVIDPILALLQEFEAGRLKVYMDVTSRGAIR